MEHDLPAPEELHTPPVSERDPTPESDTWRDFGEVDFDEVWAVVDAEAARSPSSSSV